MTSHAAKHGVLRFFPDAYRGYVLSTNVLFAALLLPLFYIHSQVASPTLITFGLLFRMIGLMLMLVGALIFARAAFHFYYAQRGKVTEGQGVNHNSKISKYLRKLRQPAHVGALLFVTGLPIYTPTIPNFVVMSMVSLDILIVHLLRDKVIVARPKAKAPTLALDAMPEPTTAPVLIPVPRA
ncbi:hypothetical protein SAMN05421823_103163 [Catalinimonas alkaloidigena]|uniref:Uncharacterized protein n=1 Tax=Catalinimonas alkaloidigena TaxID=1075417 RepID=A0A1G9DKY2_9BACT|nr:hypothetical protein [Catalinimonas alkaloidigena]SDK64460.1 hypothetical protein SAMN05421823_103163 [Catalinimonas alkaloidigena]